MELIKNKHTLPLLLLCISISPIIMKLFTFPIHPGEIIDTILCLQEPLIKILTYRETSSHLYRIISYFWGNISSNLIWLRFLVTILLIITLIFITLTAKSMNGSLSYFLPIATLLPMGIVIEYATVFLPYIFWITFISIALFLLIKIELGWLNKYILILFYIVLTLAILSHFFSAVIVSVAIVGWIYHNSEQNLRKLKFLIPFIPSLLFVIVSLMNIEEFVNPALLPSKVSTNLILLGPSYLMLIGMAIFNSRSNSLAGLISKIGIAMAITTLLVQIITDRYQPKLFLASAIPLTLSIMEKFEKDELQLIKIIIVISCICSIFLQIIIYSRITNLFKNYNKKINVFVEQSINERKPIYISMMGGTSFMIPYQLLNNQPHFQSSCCKKINIDNEISPNVLSYKESLFYSYCATLFHCKRKNTEFFIVPFQWLNNPLKIIKDKEFNFIGECSEHIFNTSSINCKKKIIIYEPWEYNSSVCLKECSVKLRID